MGILRCCTRGRSSWLLAVEVCKVLKNESPNIFHDIEVYEETDGMPAVRVVHSKV